MFLLSHSVIESACVYSGGVRTSVQCVPSPLLTSSADSPQSDDAILSQKEYGELVIFMSRS